MKKFYMLWAEGKAGPTKKHETREAAKQEAARLITQSGLTEVYILEAVSVVYPESQPIVETPLE